MEQPNAQTYIEWLTACLRIQQNVAHERSEYANVLGDSFLVRTSYEWTKYIGVEINCI